MLYLLLCEDKPDSQSLRLATRDAHLAYVAERVASVRLAGPLLADDGESMIGSLFILEAEDADQVTAFHEADPYTRAGLWEKVTIRPFRQALP
ncbi:MAG: YciI family protein [Pseudomonadota bacterium]